MKMYNYVLFLVSIGLEWRKMLVFVYKNKKSKQDDVIKLISMICLICIFHEILILISELSHLLV